MCQRVNDVVYQTNGTVKNVLIWRFFMSYVCLVRFLLLPPRHQKQQETAEGPSHSQSKKPAKFKHFSLCEGPEAKVLDRWRPHNSMVSCVCVGPDFVISGGDAIGLYSLTTHTFLISCWNSQLVTCLHSGSLLNLPEALVT